MSIFGVKRKHVDTLALKQEIFNMRGQAFSQINNLNDRHTGLQNTVREIHINHRLLYNKVENIPDKKIISICAESKGPLQNNEVFSFGNGGREVGVGYVMNFPGQILGIGLSSKRLKGDVSVVVSINENHQTGYDITLNTVLRKHDNFDKPLRVEAGDAIDFVCKSNNSTCVNTVVSMIIELFIYIHFLSFKNVCIRK